MLFFNFSSSLKLVFAILHLICINNEMQKYDKHA
jgi:hypothetical protein